MATNIKIAGSVVVFESAHTLKELEKVAAYKAEAMCLKDEEGNITFSVLPGVIGTAGPDGIVYSIEAPDGSGKATLTMPLPEIEGEDAKAAVAAVYGPMIAKANKVENQISAALTEVNAMLAAVEAQITIV